MGGLHFSGKDALTPFPKKKKLRRVRLRALWSLRRCCYMSIEQKVNSRKKLLVWISSRNSPLLSEMSRYVFGSSYLYMFEVLYRRQRQLGSASACHILGISY